MHNMTIWIFVSSIMIGTSPVDVATGLQYAFVRKETCEYAIEGSKTLRCVELKLLK